MLIFEDNERFDDDDVGHLSLSCPEVTLQDESKVVENRVQHHHLINIIMIIMVVVGIVLVVEVVVMVI